jgi:hypothetical protein
LAILSALYNASIHRLRNTWKALPKKSIAEHQRLTELTSTERAYQRLRTRMEEIKEEFAIPYL